MSASKGGRGLALVVWGLAAIVVLLAFSRKWFPRAGERPRRGRGPHAALHHGHHRHPDPGRPRTAGLHAVAVRRTRAGGFRRPFPNGRSGAGRWRPRHTMALIAEGGVLALGLPVWNQYFVSTRTGQRPNHRSHRGAVRVERPLRRPRRRVRPHRAQADHAGQSAGPGPRRSAAARTISSAST